MTKQPSYVGQGATSSPGRPSYLGAMNGADDGRPKPKLRSMAEQVGEYSARERLQDDERRESDLPTDVHTDLKDREVQPAGFQPFAFLKQRVESFLESSAVKNGYRMYKHIVFEILDVPVIDISEAYRQKYTPTIILGTEKERSTTRLFMKFQAPGPDTSLKALEALLTQIVEWDAGEKTYGREKNYIPKAYIYGTYDYPEEVIVVIA